jgi:glutaredoxin
MIVTSSYALRGGLSLIESDTEVSSMTVKPKVYALTTCPYCKRTKRFLEDHKIAYDCIDVDLLDDSKQDDVLDEIEKLTGRRSFPVVIIGKEIIVGHDETKLRKALRL